jgi:hypothetical protein
MISMSAVLYSPPDRNGPGLLPRPVLSLPSVAAATRLAMRKDLWDRDDAARTVRRPPVFARMSKLDLCANNLALVC